MPPRIETRKNTTSHVGGYLLTGTVVSSDPGTFGIVIQPDGQGNLDTIQGIPLAATFAHSLGFKETILPTVGSRVLCYGGYSGFCLVIGTIAPMEMQSKEKHSAMPSKVALGVGEPLNDLSHCAGYFETLVKSGIFNNQLPTDVVQGEKVIANEYGVMLGLFQLMAMLKGSDLAQVQCHFLDDLVRIISHNFQHYTALGEHNIFHDGKGLHLEIGMTHDPKESMGVPQVTEQGDNVAAIKDLKDDSTRKSEFYSIEDERLKAIERLKIFVGKLGDFINILLVHPSENYHALDGRTPETTEEEEDIDQESDAKQPIVKSPDKGLLQLHAGLDGLLVIRSTQGIILEKTNWIRVPERVRSPEDPEGDDGTKLNYKVREPFTFDNKYKDSEIPFLYYLQLKDYLAYINEERNYSNFKIHAKDFYVNDDYSKEKPLESITFVDPITKTSFTRKRSLLALMPNGGISMSDAWGSAINMEGGNIYIQPAKDLIVQPMRNVVVKAGGSASVAVRKEIDLSSTQGGLRVKTDRSQYLYSDGGGIVLDANGPAIPNGSLPYDTGEPVEYAGGIVLKSANAGVNSYGKQIYNRATELLTIAGKRTTLHAEDMLQMISKGAAYLYSKRQMLASKSVTEIYSSGNLIAMGNTSTVIAKKGQRFALAKAGPMAAPVEGLMDETEEKQKEFFDHLEKLVKDFGKQERGDMLFMFKEDENFEKLKFYFLPSARYSLTEDDIIPQTLVQLEEYTFPGFHAHEKWVEKAVNDTYPYPGKDKAECFVTHEIKNMEQDDKDLLNKVTELVTKTEFSNKANIFEEYTVSL